MTREEWAQIEALFDEARQRTGPDRTEWLDASGANPDTRRLVEQMLGLRRELGSLDPSRFGQHARHTLAPDGVLGHRIRRESRPGL